MPDELPQGQGPDTVPGGLLPAEELLCASEDLAERGRAFVWDVTVWGRPARAFALRFDGQPVAYLNRCVHVPTEMDWQEGEFLDMDRRWILCSIHGAAYEPADGRCVGGPCGRGKLTAVRVAERGGQVYWYPSRDVTPVRFDEAPAPAGAAAVSGPLPTAAAEPAAAMPAPSETGPLQASTADAQDENAPAPTLPVAKPSPPSS